MKYGKSKNEIIDMKMGKTVLKWWVLRDSNPGPPRYERGALTN